MLEYTLRHDLLTSHMVFSPRNQYPHSQELLVPRKHGSRSRMFPTPIQQRLIISTLMQHTKVCLVALGIIPPCVRHDTRIGITVAGLDRADHDR